MWMRAFSVQPPSEPGVPAFQAPGSPAIYAAFGTTSAFCIAHPSWSFSLIACAPSPCGPSLAVSRLAGRYPGDYCGHSVAIGLASLRRSHVHTAVRIEHDLGVPSVSLNALTGHRSCAPEDCSGLVANPPQGPVPVSGVFPAGAVLHLLETRLQAIRLSPYRADLPARHPVRLGMNCRFPGMLFSPGYPFGTGSAIRSRDISSRPCPLRGRYSSAPHGAPTTTGTLSP